MEPDKHDETGSNAQKLTPSGDIARKKPGRWRTLTLCIFTGVIVAAVAFCVWPRQPGPAPDPKLFDRIVTEDLIRSAGARRVPYVLTSNHEDEKLSYHVSFKLSPPRPGLYYGVGISISSAPRGIFAPGPNGFSIALGPGGGGTTETFRTQDGLFDIEVEVSNRLSDKVVAPNLSVDRLIRLINKRYSEMLGN